MVRRAIHRSDTHQTAIVAALRKAGYSVVITSGLGDGYPDIHVAKIGRSWLIEIKTSPSKKLSDTSVFSLGRTDLLTPEEFEFHAYWPVPIPIVFTAEEALKVIRGKF
jgi:hypothetical protein